MAYGFARFDSLDAYARSKSETPLQQARDLLSKLLKEHGLSTESPSPAQAPPITDWPRITECIKRHGHFLLTIQQTGLRASLNFNLSPPFDGSYEIHIPLLRRNERGRIVKVVELCPADLYDERLSMLTRFQNRYLVTTSAADRQGTQFIWRVGIERFREVDGSQSGVEA